MASEEAFDAHLTDFLIPYVTDLYKQSSKIKTNLHDFCSDIVEAVKKGHSPDDVCTFYTDLVNLSLIKHYTVESQ